MDSRAHDPFRLGHPTPFDWLLLAFSILTVAAIVLPRELIPRVPHLEFEEVPSRDVQLLPAGHLWSQAPKWFVVRGRSHASSRN